MGKDDLTESSETSIKTEGLISHSLSKDGMLNLVRILKKAPSIMGNGDKVISYQERKMLKKLLLTEVALIIMEELRRLLILQEKMV